VNEVEDKGKEAKNIEHDEPFKKTEGNGLHQFNNI
jgi:hypothetical protein